MWGRGAEREMSECGEGGVERERSECGEEEAERERSECGEGEQRGVSVGKGSREE